MQEVFIHISIEGKFIKEIIHEVLEIRADVDFREIEQ